MAVVKKYATVVNVDFNLRDIEVGEQVVINHDAKNEWDKKALSVMRFKGKEDIGYVSASPHTTLSGCISNSELFPYLPANGVPLVGKVVSHDSLSFRNGTIAPALIVEILVVTQDRAV